MTPAFTLRRWLADTFERSVTTLVQALLVFLPTLTAWHTDTWKAIVAASLPAVAAVLLSAISVAFPTPSSWIVDAAFRVLRTFAGTILAALAAGAFDLFSAGAWRAVFLASLMAAASLLKTIIARRVSNTVTPASFLPMYYAIE